MSDELIKVAEDSTRGSFFLISGNVISTLILAVASIFVARFLGPGLYGQYTLALVIPQLLTLFTNLGIDQGITKYTAKYRKDGEISRITEIVKHGLLIKVTVAIFISALSYALADLFGSVLLQRPDLALYIRIASLSIVLQVIFTAMTSAFVGLDKTEYDAIATNIQSLVKAISSVSLVLLGFGIAGAITGYTGSFLAAAVVSLVLFLAKLRSKQNGPRTSLAEDAKILLRYGTPIYIALLIGGLAPLYLSMILAQFATDAAIGNYKAASNFLSLLTVLSFPITIALVPAFSKLESTTEKKIRVFYNYATKYTTMLILPIAILIMIFSKEIVQIIYGSTYQSAPIFLATYCIVYFLAGMGSLTLTGLYNGLGETKTTLKMSLIDFVVILVASPILTQVYNVLGLILASIAASIASTSYGSYHARTHLKTKFDFKSTAKIYAVSLVASTPSLLLLLTLPINRIASLIMGTTLYLFTYITLIPLTGVLAMSELETIEQVLEKIRILKSLAQPFIKYEQRILKRKEQIPNKKT